MRTILPKVRSKPTKDIFQSGFDRHLKRTNDTEEKSDIYKFAHERGNLSKLLNANDTNESVTKSKTILIVAPTTDDNFTIFPTQLITGITISRIRAVWYSAAGSPSADWTIRFSDDRSAAGTELKVGGYTTTNQSTGDNLTDFDNKAIPQSNWVWVDITAIGTIADSDNLSITIFYE